jgi:hypothetical protein
MARPTAKHYRLILSGTVNVSGARGARWSCYGLSGPANSFRCHTASGAVSVLAKWLIAVRARTVSVCS